MLLLAVSGLFMSCEKENLQASQEDVTGKLAEDFITSFFRMEATLAETMDQMSSMAAFDRMATPTNREELEQTFRMLGMRVTTHELDAFFETVDRVYHHLRQFPEQESAFSDYLDHEKASWGPRQQQALLRSSGKMKCLREYDERNWQIVKDMGQCAGVALVMSAGVGSPVCGLDGLWDLAESRAILNACLKEQ